MIGKHKNKSQMYITRFSIITMYTVRYLGKNRRDI